MSSRHPAHEAVRNRVLDAATENDTAGLLTEDAVRDARELAEMVEARCDLKAAWALGMFHWMRYLSLPDGDDLEDYTAAIRILGPVYDEDPDVVPAPLRRRFGLIRGHDGPPPPDPVELNSRARKMLARYRQTGDLPFLTEAVALFRAALAAEKAEGAEESLLAPRKSNLGAGLRMLYTRTGDPDLLTEAVTVQRASVEACPAHHPDRPAYLSNLAAALTRLSEATGDITQLQEVTDLLYAALATVPRGDIKRPCVLFQLRLGSAAAGRTDR